MKTVCLVALTSIVWSAAVHAGGAAFSDQTAAAGLSFRHLPFADHGFDRMSGGATVGDFNADGRPDLFVLGGGGRADALFINDGNGGFTDQASAWGLAEPHRGIGATAGDYDGDGLQDLFVTSLGPMSEEPGIGRHRLYRNNGDGSFTDVAQAAGVAQTADIPDGLGASFGDYDLDGDLDLFVAGWETNPDTGLALGSRLFRNTGDGSFVNVNLEAGVLGERCKGFGAVFADMDGDRYPEMLIAGDFGTSFYYRNNRDGTFSALDIWEGQGNGKAYNGMGTTVADWNRDGRLDWFVTAIYPAYRDASPYWGNGIYFNDGPGAGGDTLFREATAAAGIADGGWGWGTAALDFDHDGLTDIAMTNGWPGIDLVTGEVFTDEPAYLYRNLDGETFAEVGAAEGFIHTSQGRGLVSLDYDADGDMDVVITSFDDELLLLRNETAGRPGANWLQVRLDTSAHPGIAAHGFGARVQVQAGGRVQTAVIHGGSNYLGRSELLAHFGLGNSGVAARVEVRWPDGFYSVLGPQASNQILTVAATRPLNQGPLLRGENVDLTVNGLRPGEVAHFFYGTAGLGEGVCYAPLGGLCGDLLSPNYLGSATADVAGTAVRTVTAPVNLALEVLYTQALIRRGSGGVNSLKTNAIEAPLLDARRPARERGPTGRLR